LQPSLSSPSAPSAPSAPRSQGADLVCGGCKNPFVRGQVYKAVDKRWHPECFLCGICQEPIVLPGKYGVRNGVPLHPQCVLQGGGSGGRMGATVSQQL